MKFISVRDLRSTPAQIWKELAQQQEMVLTSNGKPIALLTPISDSNLEETLQAMRKARASQAVQQMQTISRDQGNDRLTDKEINMEIAAARKDRQP